MDLFSRDNDALNTNPPSGDQHLTTNGSNWLWAVCAVFAVSWLAFVGLTKSAKGGEKIFHYLFSVALFVGLISYFAMASDLGANVISQANNLHELGFTRQIFWPKYVFWAVAFPTVTIALGLISGVSWATIAYEVAIAWIWVISYLVGAHTRSNYKWGFFVFGTIAFVWLAFNTFFRGLRASDRVFIKRDYTILAGWVNFLWLMYPIAWAVSDGGNRIGVVAHFIWFGILDILLIPGTGFVLLALSRRWDYSTLGLRFTQHGRISKENHNGVGTSATTRHRAAPGVPV